jgi:hypothetical protein
VFWLVFALMACANVYLLLQLQTGLSPTAVYACAHAHHLDLSLSLSLSFLFFVGDVKNDA